MDTVITTVATAAITAGFTSLASKGASAPAQTLNLLWQATLGRWDPKLKQIINKNIEKYSKEINHEIDKIPSEKINPNPDISIIGPALEASKFYVGKEESRKMFAKLIAAELNIETADKVHHSFVDIIKQMSSNDARLLTLLPTNGPLAQICLYSKNRKSYKQLTVNDIVIIPGHIENHFVENAISINNLARLRIVEIDHVFSVSDSSVYEPYKQLNEYKQGLQAVKEYPEQFSVVEVKGGMFAITPFGELFKRICL